MIAGSLKFNSVDECSSRFLLAAGFEQFYRAETMHLQSRNQEAHGKFLGDVARGYFPPNKNDRAENCNEIVN